jgi:hypothetical protein
MPLLQFLTLTFLEHPRPEFMPDDHSMCDNCAEQDDVKVPAGDVGSDETKDAEEGAERGVHMVCEAVEWRVRRTCIHVYKG